MNMDPTLRNSPHVQNPAQDHHGPAEYSRFSPEATFVKFGNSQHLHFPQAIDEKPRCADYEGNQSGGKGDVKCGEPSDEPFLGAEHHRDQPEFGSGQGRYAQGGSQPASGADKITHVPDDFADGQTDDQRDHRVDNYDAPIDGGEISPAQNFGGDGHLRYSLITVSRDDW